MAIRINYADPEAQGLTSCFLVTQGGMKDLVREVYPVRGGTADPYRSGETFKIESVFNGTTDNYNDTSTTVDNSVNPFTVVWESYLDAGAGTYAAFTTYMSARGLGPLILFYTSDPSYSDITMVSALWQHGPRMLELMTQRKLAWPRFTTQQMSDLIAYLNSL